jgi:putative transposase
VQSDEHFLTVCRSVERNALRANLVGRAEDWWWGRLGVPRTKNDADRRALTPWPIDRPRDWTDRVNRPFGAKEEEAVRRSIQLLGGVWRVIGGGTKEEEAVLRSIRREQPYGWPSWQAAVAKRLGLESVFRPRGRPRKEPQNGSRPPYSNLFGNF